MTVSDLNSIIISGKIVEINGPSFTLKVVNHNHNMSLVYEHEWQILPMGKFEPTIGLTVSLVGRIQQDYGQTQILADSIQVRNESALV